MSSPIQPISIHVGDWSSEAFSRYIFTLEGKDMVVSASDLMPIKITPRARHTFKADETHEGPCSIEISTAISPRSPAGDPEGEGMNEKLYVPRNQKLVCLT